MNDEFSLGVSPTHVSDPYLLREDFQRGAIKEDEGASLTLRELVARLPETLTTQKNLGIRPGSREDGVLQMLSQVKIGPEELKAYAQMDPDRKYTRNLISSDNETYTLMILCWNPKKESPIHDHPCDGCWMRVVQGEVRECRYQENKTKKARACLECTLDESYHQGQVLFINDTIGYHKVGNNSSELAMTLHVYAPPFEECRTWLDPKKQASQANMCYYSAYGQRL